LSDASLRTAAHARAQSIRRVAHHPRLRCHQWSVPRGLLLPHFGLAIAFVFSGLLLSLCIVVVAVLLVPWFGQLDASHYFLIGTFWVGLTLIFEFGFGRLAQQKTWTQLLDAYTFRDGNLWPLVVLVIAFAPWLAARLRGWLARVAK